MPPAVAPPLLPARLVVYRDSLKVMLSPSTYAPTGRGLDVYMDGEGFYMFGNKDDVIQDGGSAAASAAALVSVIIDAGAILGSVRVHIVVHKAMGGAGKIRVSALNGVLENAYLSNQLALFPAKHILSGRIGSGIPGHQAAVLLSGTGGGQGHTQRSQLGTDNSFARVQNPNYDPSKGESGDNPKTIVSSQLTPLRVPLSAV